MPKASCILMMDVDNEFGVLTRITALIRRAGLNIKGLCGGRDPLPRPSPG